MPGLGVGEILTVLVFIAVPALAGLGAAWLTTKVLNRL